MKHENHDIILAAHKATRTRHEQYTSAGCSCHILSALSTSTERMCGSAGYGTLVVHIDRAQARYYLDAAMHCAKEISESST